MIEKTDVDIITEATQGGPSLVSLLALLTGLFSVLAMVMAAIFAICGMSGH